MSDNPQTPPKPQAPALRPDIVVVPMGQPLPKPPGIEWWLRWITRKK